MKLLKTITLLTFIIFLNITPFFSQQIIKYNKKSKKDSKPYIEGEIIVKFKESISSFTINNTNKRNNTSIKTYSKQDSNLKLLKYDKDDSIDNIIDKYKNDPNVEFVQPNYIYTILNSTPNDTYFSNQWGLKNSNDCDIDIDEVWDTYKGDPLIVVAVIDTGVDYLHPDLIANLWDDGSGNCGYDFINNDSEPMDLEGHGTIVAGIIGTVTNNSTGIAGVAWEVQIMAVRGLDENGFGTSYSLSNSIDYARLNEADIINASWGSYYDDNAIKTAIEKAALANILFVAAAGNNGLDNDNLSTPMYPASYNLSNVISVAASDQNDNLASFSNYGQSSVHVCAPGVDIISTVPIFTYAMSNINENKDFFIYSFFGFIILFPALFFKKKKKYYYKNLLLILSIIFILFLTIKCQLPIEEKSSSSSTKSDTKPVQKIVSGHDYAITSGTSVAAPFITGIAVLMKTKKPAITPAEMITILSDPSNSDSSASLNNKVVSDGRINARKVLNAVIP